MYINKFLVFILILINIISFVNSKIQIKESIIMPTYNRALFLDRSIQCILNQSLKEIELIIVNECSTDNTNEVLSKYKNDSRVRIINLDKNAGQGNARNKGIMLARGEFIGFMDDDDYVDKQFYEKLYHYSKDKDVIVGTFLDCISDSKYCSYNIEQENYDSTILDEVNYKTEGIYGFVINSLWRRSFLKENNILFPNLIDPTKNIYEDRNFRIECYKKSQE